MSVTKSVVLSKNLDMRISKRAKKEGITLSDLIRDALESYLNIDPGLMKAVLRFAAVLDTHPMIIISNLATSKFAKMNAEREVFGPSNELLDEFFRIDGVVATGDTLYNTLKTLYIQEFEKIKKEDEDNERSRS
jgi:hypothetical protein